jgi:hypothetical protein
MSKQEYTPESAAIGVEQAISSFRGRWKLVILFHLFGGNMLRFSDLERAKGRFPEDAHAAAQTVGARWHGQADRACPGPAKGRV